MHHIRRDLLQRCHQQTPGLEIAERRDRPRHRQLRHLHARIKQLAPVGGRFFAHAVYYVHGKAIRYLSVGHGQHHRQRASTKRFNHMDDARHDEALLRKRDLSLKISRYGNNRIASVRSMPT